jgi:hypothetical protein
VTTTVQITLSALPSPSFRFYSDASCSNEVTSLNADTGTNVIGFYFKGVVAGTVTVSVTANGLTGSSQDELIRPGPATAVILSGGGNPRAGDCAGPVTVSLRDAHGNPTVSSTNVSVSLTSSGQPVTFSSTNTCITGTTGVAIPADAGSATFFFKGLSAGNTTITGLPTGGLASGSVTVTINPGPPVKLAFTTSPQTVSAGACSGQTGVQFRDDFDNPSSPTADSPVLLSVAPNKGFRFYDSALCLGSPITEVSPTRSMTGVIFYFKADEKGTFSINVGSTGVTGASQTQTISP